MEQSDNCQKGRWRRGERDEGRWFFLPSRTFPIVSLNSPAHISLANLSNVVALDSGAAEENSLLAGQEKEGP